MVSRDAQLQRARLPWTAQDDNDHIGDDPEAGPYASLRLQGSSGPRAVPLGTLVTDTLIVTNLENRAPELVRVQATLPAGMTFVGGTVPQGSIALEGNQIVARLGALQIGASTEITVTLQPTSAGRFTRSYSLSSELPDPRLADNAVSLHTRVRKLLRLPELADPPEILRSY
jgi:uncharacterized repeat protein (TIGR01451 family)